MLAGEWRHCSADPLVGAQLVVLVVQHDAATAHVGARFAGALAADANAGGHALAPQVAALDGDNSGAVGHQRRDACLGASQEGQRRREEVIAHGLGAVDRVAAVRK